MSKTKVNPRKYPFENKINPGKPSAIKEETDPSGGVTEKETEGLETEIDIKTQNALLVKIFDAWAMSLFAGTFAAMTRAFAHYREGQAFDIGGIRRGLNSKGNPERLVTDLEKFQKELFKIIST